MIDEMKRIKQKKKLTTTKIKFILSLTIIEVTMSKRYIVLEPGMTILPWLKEEDGLEGVVETVYGDLLSGAAATYEKMHKTA